MAKRNPLPGEWYLHGSDVYKVLLVSSGTDSIVLKRLSDNSKMEVRYSVFKFGFERVFKIGAVAEFIKRSPRSIYRYESEGTIEKPKRYPDAFGREIRFYTKSDILSVHEMVSEIQKGKPRKDRRVVNNTLPSKADLLIEFRERYGE